MNPSPRLSGVLRSFHPLKGGDTSNLTKNTGRWRCGRLAAIVHICKLHTQTHTPVLLLCQSWSTQSSLSSSSVCYQSSHHHHHHLFNHKQLFSPSVTSHFILTASCFHLPAPPALRPVSCQNYILCRKQSIPLIENAIIQSEKGAEPRGGLTFEQK